VLGVSESDFHARLEVEILAAQQRTRETYNAKRLYYDWPITVCDLLAA